MLVRLLELGEAVSKYGQVALGSRGAGVRDTEDVVKPPGRVLEKFLGKYQFVSRGSSALQDRIRVTVGQLEGYVMVGTGPGCHARRPPRGRDVARGD